jgi:hypothetical protein
MMAEGIGGRFVDTSEDERSGSTSSLMRRSSTLRLICLSSSLSAGACPSNARPWRRRMLPLVVKRLLVPVEFARRERVFRLGEAGGGVGLEVGGGCGDVLVKLVLRGSRSMLLRRRGNERRFSSKVEAGDAERGESRTDMDTVRVLDGRDEAAVSLGVGGRLQVFDEW